MTRPPLSRRQIAVCIGLFSALGSFGIAACTKVNYIYPQNLQGFALPPKCPMGTPPTTGPQLSACLAGIQFDTAEFVGDEQRLMVRESTPEGPRCHSGSQLFACTYGPLAKIEPVKGAELYSNLALKQGRIIARMYLRATETDSYPKLGLAPGDTTYWWVRIEKDTSVFIRRGAMAMDGTLPSRGRRLERTPHSQGAFQQATARWVWDPLDEKANGACGSSCCKPN